MPLPTSFKYFSSYSLQAEIRALSTPSFDLSTRIATKKRNFFIALVYAFASMIFGPTASAASFNCSHAKSFSEKTVCGDAQLSAKDDLLGALYERAYSTSADKHAIAATRDDEWHWRQVHCKDVACVESWYDRRIAELRADYVLSRRGLAPAPKVEAVHEQAAQPAPAQVLPTPVAKEEPTAVPTSKALEPKDKGGNGASAEALKYPLPRDFADSPLQAAPFVCSGGAKTEAKPAKSPDASLSTAYPPLPAMSGDTFNHQRRHNPGTAAVPASSRMVGVYIEF